MERILAGLIWPVGNLRILLLIGIACSFIGGCGYRHVGYGEGRLESGAKTITIPLFANKSYRSNLEVIISASLVDEFAKRSGGKVVSGENADLQLSGTVESYTVVPVAYTSFDTIKEYRITIAVKAALKEKASQKVLWRGELNDTQTYPVFSDIALQQNAEEAAIREICRKISQRLYQKLSEDF